MTDELAALALAAALLALVLVVSYMCLQLYLLRRPAPLCPEGFRQRQLSWRE